MSGLGGNDTLTLSEVNGALPAANLFGGAGNDTLDGGPGSNIVLQSLGADRVTSATAAGTAWLTTHARIVNGKTVLTVGGKQRTLPRANLAELARAAGTI